MTVRGDPLEKYSRRTQFYTDEVPPLLSSLLQDTSWKKCLDLGSGDGGLLRALDCHGYLEGKSVYALDVSKSRVSLVRTVNPDFGCVVGSASDTPIREGGIDLLISTQVIEHVPDDWEMVKELHRILAANGVLYLSTVFKKPYGWYFYRCNGKWTLDPTHLREYTLDNQLLDKLRQRGFEILHNVKTQDTRPLMDAVLRRLHAGRRAYDNPVLRRLRKFRVPIIGYYIWEIVCRKIPARRGGRGAEEGIS